VALVDDPRLLGDAAKPLAAVADYRGLRLSLTGGALCAFWGAENGG
jgi:hypothetical protein